jgi:Ca2+-binding RTX toxin-like protein
MRKLVPLLLALAAVLVIIPAASAKVVTGTSGDDTLTGTGTRDFIYGRAGNDSLAGLAGSDFLFGGAGNDSLSGDDGRDFGFGGAGDDSLDGGNGPDLLYAGFGTDTLEGGAGNDQLYASADDGKVDVVDCGPGDDDRASIRTGDMAIDCEHVRSVSGHAPNRGVVKRGTPGDDVLDGTEGRDFIYARAGNDTVSGLGGSDFLFGQSGNDTVAGGDGRDFMWGGSEDDSLDGGAGNDWIWLGWGTDTGAGGDGNDHVFAAADDALVDTIDCGENDGDWDVAVIRPGDSATNCEKVITLSP